MAFLAGLKMRARMKLSKIDRKRRGLPTPSPRRPAKPARQGPVFAALGQIFKRFNSQDVGG
jgi:hypothetical protein